MGKNVFSRTPQPQRAKVASKKEGENEELMKSYIVQLEEKIQILENDSSKESMSLMTMAFMQKIDLIADINFSKQKSEFVEGIKIHRRIDEVIDYELKHGCRSTKSILMISKMCHQRIPFSAFFALSQRKSTLTQLKK